MLEEPGVARVPRGEVVAQLGVGDERGVHEVVLADEGGEHPLLAELAEQPGGGLVDRPEDPPVPTEHVAGRVAKRGQVASLDCAQGRQLRPGLRHGYSPLAGLWGAGAFRRCFTRAHTLKTMRLR